MSDLVKCFWLEPTEQVEVSLRRFRWSRHGDTCGVSGYGYHNATRVLKRAHRSEFPDHHGDWHDHADSNWPTHCKCGYQFPQEDEWQANPDQLYRRQDTGELFTRDSAPAGAMLHMGWCEDHTLYRKGEDGIVLGVKVPGNTWWCVDGPAYRDQKLVPGSWKRTGAVPVVTAHPSIDVTGSYHGWLQDGYLKRC